ncbi:hypothetical protein [Echinicola shivajiensis]|uniref:hypothetical protein n=1 Tax=Echinicola shivajiensis TaxID=1035916 RepID=UPI001BFC8DEF|nr:hypothetical protein [Echinicola shivajiensis]
MKTILFLIAYLVMAVSFTACTTDNHEFPKFELDGADLQDLEDYSVYQTILEDYSLSNMLVKQETSIILPLSKDLQLFFNSNTLKMMEDGLFQKFMEENTSVSFLDQNKINFHKEVKLISNGEYSFIFGNDDHKAWEIMQSRYDVPDGYHTVLNKIAYSADRNQAFVGGQDYYFLMVDGKRQTKKMGWVNYMEKENNEWISKGQASYFFD